MSDGGNTSRARSHSSIEEEEEWWNKGKRVQQVYGGTEMIDEFSDENYMLVFNNMPRHWR